MDIPSNPAKYSMNPEHYVHFRVNVWCILAKPTQTLRECFDKLPLVSAI